MTVPLLASPERSAAGRQYHPVMSASAPFSGIRGREAELRELSLALDHALVDDQSLIDLYPFLLVRPCQVCGALEVYHPASFSDDEVHLKSIDRGHSQVTSDARLLGAVQAAFA
jgi:hypothetical protein